MEMCYDGALVMPSNYVVMSEDEMMYVEGGKKYYDKAGRLANSCQVSADVMIAEGLLLTGVNPIAGGLTAVICSHNANMWLEAKGLCKGFKSSKYITLTVNYSGLWITSVSAKKGK